MSNLLDLDAEIRLATSFAEPAIAIIKHTNPCGVARRDTLADALRAAIESDPSPPSAASSTPTAASTPTPRH